MKTQPSARGAGSYVNFSAAVTVGGNQSTRSVALWRGGEYKGGCTGYQQMLVCGKRHVVP